MRSRIAAALGFLETAGLGSAEMRWISRSHCAELMLPPVARDEDTVLTRLPAPHRSTGLVVREFLESRFSEPFLRLNERAYRQFVLGLPDHGIAGGSAYDALVAATAAFCGAELVSCDRRAIQTYERYGVRAQLLF